MNAQSVDSAIRDVAPALPDPFPEKLKQLTSQLYLSSKQKIGLKQNEEVARLHLCAVIAIQKLQSQLDIVDPSLQNIPIPTKLAKSLLDLFHSQLQSKSNASTPNTTPRKRKAPTAPSTPSPLKKTVKILSSAKNTPFLQKLEAAAAEKPGESETEGTPKGNETPKKKNESPTKNLMLVSSREIITLCNKFQLGKEVADHITESFLKYSPIISNDWILIVGLVLNCYFVINYNFMNANVGTRSSVLKTMHGLQNGGLKLKDIQSSVDLVNKAICYSKWFKKLKYKYGYPLDEASKFDDLGMMVSEKYQYNSAANKKRYEEWIFEIEQELKQMEKV